MQQLLWIYAWLPALGTHAGAIETGSASHKALSSRWDRSLENEEGFPVKSSILSTYWVLEARLEAACLVTACNWAGLCRQGPRWRKNCVCVHREPCPRSRGAVVRYSGVRYCDWGPDLQICVLSLTSLWWFASAPLEGNKLNLTSF